MSAIILEHQPNSLEQKIQLALSEARQLTQQGERKMASVAWSEVEELCSKLAHQKQAYQNNFELYCQENPEAPEARIYDV